MNAAAFARCALCLRLLLVACLLSWACLLRADVPVPPLVGRVTDLTQTLDPAQRAALEQTLAQFEARKGAQLAVLILPTTSPESIEQYAVRVQESWQLGRKGVDDGVLLVVAKDDRRLRIEVGYGLEGVLPDAVAKRILAEDIEPRFKVGDFNGGVRAGVDRIIRVVEGEPLPPPRPGSAAATEGAGDQLLSIVFLTFALVSVLGAFLGAVFGRTLGAMLAAAIVGAMVWLFTSLLFLGVVAAVLGFVVAFFREILVGAAGLRGGRGGGFGAGGFGGGGGRSGGGGASGGW